MMDWYQRVAFGLTNRNSYALITNADGSKQAVRDALAELEEQAPDEAALLQEHADCGKSTDPRWNEDS